MYRFFFKKFVKNHLKKIEKNFLFQPLRQRMFQQFCNYYTYLGFWTFRGKLSLIKSERGLLVKSTDLGF